MERCKFLESIIVDISKSIKDGTFQKSLEKNIKKIMKQKLNQEFREFRKKKKLINKLNKI